MDTEIAANLIYDTENKSLDIRNELKLNLDYARHVEFAPTPF